MSSDFRQGMLVGTILTALAVITFVVIASAQVSLSVFGASKHTEKGFCEFNPGLGIGYQIAPNWRLAAVRYKNSLCVESTAFGAIYQPIRIGSVAVGVALLRVTGYQDAPIYAPIPLISVEMKGYAIDAIVAAKDREGVIGLGLRFPL